MVELHYWCMHPPFLAFLWEDGCVHGQLHSLVELDPSLQSPEFHSQCHIATTGLKAKEALGEGYGLGEGRALCLWQTKRRATFFLGKEGGTRATCRWQSYLQPCGKCHRFGGVARCSLRWRGHSLDQTSLQEPKWSFS